MTTRRGGGGGGGGVSGGERDGRIRGGNVGWCDSGVGFAFSRRSGLFDDDGGAIIVRTSSFLFGDLFRLFFSFLFFFFGFRWKTPFFLVRFVSFDHPDHSSVSFSNHGHLQRGSTLNDIHFGMFDVVL